MSSELIAAVEIISALAATGLIYSTLNPCKASGIPYLLGVPAGFGLIAIAFLMNAITFAVGPTLQFTGILLSIVNLLTQTYGVMFLALTYARRTRLKLVGESSLFELAAGSVITVILLAYVLFLGMADLPDTAVRVFGIPLRIAVAAAYSYLIFETARNWQLTQRASEGFATIGFAFLIVGQIGFILEALSLGDVAVFLGYEGRLLGLFVLNAITYVGIRKGDFLTVLKRLGLAAPAH